MSDASLQQRLQGVLIDLDGTLMDTIPDLAEAVNRMLAELGRPALAVERVAMFVGKGADSLVHRALTNDLAGRAEEALFKQGRAAFNRHYHAVNGAQAIVFDRVPSALQQLRGRGLRLCCVTNKPREFTLPLMERARLAPYFDAVVAGDDVPEKKPHPASLLEACRLLNIAPAQAAMIGDSVNDALAAEAAGIRCVLVDTGYNEGEGLGSLADRAVIVPALFDAASLLLQSVDGNSLETDSSAQ